MASTLTRDNVIAERKWDLSGLFADETQWQSLYDEVDASLGAIGAYRNRLNVDNVFECLRLESDTSRRIERLYMYAALRKDEDTSRAVYQSMAEKAEMLMVRFSTEASFVTPEIAKFPVKTLRALAADPAGEAFSVYFENVIREKKHILSAKEEKVLSQIASFTRDFRQIFSMFDNADIKFGRVSDGKEEVELSHGMFSVLLQNPDQNVRKEAFFTYYQPFIEMHNTLAATYGGSVKKDCTLAALRGYKSALHRALYAESVPQKVYDNLLAAVKKGTPAVHRYVALRKKALGVKELHMYDMYVPIVPDVDLTKDYDEAFELVKQALHPLGDRYRELLDRAKAQRWIDVEETRNKRSGAYSWGCYDSNPFVLLNYRPTLHDVFTIAHELGHSMHSYLSNEAQCYEKAGYEIFVAEIASTVNEVLLLKYMLGTAEGAMRKYLLSYYLDMFRTTLFRQTMFAEFEKFAHDEIERGQPLTAESMNRAYLELNKKYYGSSVVHDDPIAYEWSRIPHFYNAFYVYKYATGLTAAVNIASRILSEPGYVDKYFAFLSAGGSLRPLEILRLAEVDLMSRKPFDVAMTEFKNTLEELKQCL